MTAPKTLKKLKRHLGFFCNRFVTRSGHEPGAADITLHSGSSFLARPNFYYFAKCGRPCYQPLYPAPRLGRKDWAVTEGFPCETYEPHGQDKSAHSYSESERDGDQVIVVGQVYGEEITNDIGEKSSLWNVISLPARQVSYNQHLLRLRHGEAGDYYLVCAPDMWFGNTGRQHVPLYTMPFN